MEIVTYPPNPAAGERFLSYPTRAATSMLSIIYSQKEATAFQDLSLSSMAKTMAGSERTTIPTVVTKLDAIMLDLRLDGALTKVAEKKKPTTTLS